jgi:hypothetical protein
VVARSGRALDLLAILSDRQAERRTTSCFRCDGPRVSAQLVVTVDQVARSSTEQLRLRATDSDAIAQLLHLAARRFFGQRGLVEVWSSGDVAVPLRSDSARGDFRIHHRKGCGYLALEVNLEAIGCGAERNAQPFVLRTVDARVRDRGAWSPA